MAKTVLQFILLFIMLVLAQVLVFNRLYLFETALPLAFIYFIMRLPVTLSSIAVMSLSFLLGLTVDIFSDTPGMNALSCTLLAVCRIPVLRLYFPREEDLTNPEPSMLSLGATVFMKYALSISIIYCIFFFTIEAFSMFNMMRLMMRIIGSSLFTFIVVMCIDTLMNQRSEKRL
ncbi:MAG: hypothetical protein NC082_08715 [Clostridiales bacterium]|nr:hypothetical protein [Clostridiales bacterium]